MIIKALILLSFISFSALAEAGQESVQDGLGTAGGPPADIVNPIAIPSSPRDTTVVAGNVPQILTQLNGQVVTDGILCKSSPTQWKPLLHTAQELERWPIEDGAGCLAPLKEFSQKLSYARAPLALSFATFIDGLEKHLGSGALRWKSCTSGCSPKNETPRSCIEATPLIQRTVQMPAGSESFVVNKAVWDEVSSKQPLVCAATVVDLWLSGHVPDKEKRVAMVNDFFSARFHANSESVIQCFDPTAATRPFEFFDGQIQDILIRIPSSSN